MDISDAAGETAEGSVVVLSTKSTAVPKVWIEGAYCAAKPPPFAEERTAVKAFLVLVGRPGLDPGTLGLKGIGGASFFIHLIQRTPYL